jgi:hypothetical protein
MSVPKIRYNYELLLECVSRDQAVLDLEFYKNVKLNRDSLIRGTCKCRNEFSKSLRQCCTVGGMFCKSCTMSHTQEKMKQTNLRIRGVEHPLQDPIVKEKIIHTNLIVRGVKNPFQDNKIKEKSKQTNLRVRGVKYSQQDPIVKEKMKQTNLSVRGVEYPSQDPKSVEKAKQTNLRIRGVKHPQQDPIVKEKMKQTNLSVRGVKNPMQDASIADKCSKNSLKFKEYLMPNQTIRKVQGYEPFALDSLVKSYTEVDIITNRQEVPHIWYIIDNKKHRHYVDIYVKSINKCIEVKSTWTIKHEESHIFEKQQAAKDMGLEYEIWVFDKKGTRVQVYE